MQKNTKKLLFILAWTLVLPVFIFGQVSFWRDVTKKAKAETPATDDIKDDISDLEKEKARAEKAKALLQQNLGQIQGAVASTQKVINTTKAVIDETKSTISRKEAEVKNLNDKIQLQKSMLKALLREVYYNQGQPILNVVFTTETLADVFSDTDHLLTIEDKIKNLSFEISKTKDQLEQDKIQLAEEKQKHEEILDDKLDQKQELVADQIDVQGDIAEKEATINEINNKLAELRGALSGFLGKSYDTKDIDDAVNFASKATGIRKEFLQAELIVETGYGTFTGGCRYDDTKNLRMRATDKAEFLKLAKELEAAYGGNYKNKKLSCTPKRNGVFFGYGGAMGVAQFMPTTWIGYKTKISAKTGSRPADPWDLADGITGMAIKLANGGATSKKGEFGASMLYYCGSTNPSPASRKAACRAYASKVQYFSKDPESHL